MGPEIQWLHSYVTGDKVYCVYLAPDEATFRNMPGELAFLPIAFLRCAGCLTLQAPSEQSEAPQLSYSNRSFSQPRCGQKKTQPRASALPQ